MKGITVIFTTLVLLVSCNNGNKDKRMPVFQTPDNDTVALFTAPQYSLDSIYETDKTTDKKGKEDDRHATSSSKTHIESAGATGNDEYNNMRGFDPASEDDMDDNGMSRYFENNDEEGWD